MIYIEDYTDAIEFILEAFDNETEFYYSEIIAITEQKDYAEVTNLLNDLVTYRNYKKEKRANDWFYSNVRNYKQDTTSYLLELDDLERMHDSWIRGLINMNDPQEKAHLNALKSHIDRLKTTSKR